MAGTRVRAMVDTAGVVVALLRATVVRVAATVVVDTEAVVVRVRPVVEADARMVVAAVDARAAVAADTQLVVAATPEVDIAKLRQRYCQQRFCEGEQVDVNEVNDRGGKGVLNGTPSLFLNSFV
jgi:hypothetical protein